LSSAGETRTGKISSIKSQQKDPSRVSIFVDGEYAFGVDAAIAREYGLRIDTPVDEEQVLAARQADAVVRALDAAMGMLKHGPRTAYEIRERLRRKGFEPLSIDRAVGRLEEKAYLDDHALARDYAAARADSRGEGLHRIRQRLVRRGVGREIIEEVLADLESSVDWREIAREEAQKRWKKLSGSPGGHRRRKKLFDYLVRRGFDYTLAREVTSEFETDR